MLLPLLAALAPPTFEVRERIPLGPGDSGARPAFSKRPFRLYVPHGDRVQIVDLTERKVVAEAADVTNAGPVALAPERDLGFVASDSGLVVFDATNGAEVKRIPLAAEPTDLAYDPRTRRVLVVSQAAKTLTLVDPQALIPEAPISLGGPAGAVVPDGWGAAFVAQGDAVERIDLAKRRVAARWPIRATKLAYDDRRKLLYAHAPNAPLLILDPKTGAVRGSVDLGAPARSLLADYELGLVFGPSDAGGLAVVHAKTAVVAQTLDAAPATADAAIDPDDHRLYLLAKDEVVVVARAKGQ